MYLKSLEIQGFKSFPDKTVLTFNRGMTAVVGPNGSGKSNISDAIRWVLGEQSSRSLRSTRMEDVIFSGTSVRRPQGFAEVTLRLDNTDRSLDYDGGTVAVTRRYFRSGESEYLINGKTVRLRDVHEVFMDTGLGRDGYSMVSQGRIEDIVSSKSNERREMFEEAVGISHYRYRRADALRRLSQAEENLLRLRDILSELEGRVGPLKTQSEKAEKFLVYAAEKKDLEIALWLHNFEKAAQSLREQSNRVTVVELQYQEAAQELERIYAESEQATDQARRITFRIEDIQRQAAVFEEQAAMVEAAVAVDRNSILHNNEAIERYEKDKTAEDDTEKHLDERIEAAAARITELEGQIQRRQHELRQAAQNLEALRTSGEQFSDELTRHMKRQSELFAALSEKKIELTSCAASIEEIGARAGTLDAAIAEKAEEAESIREKAAFLEKKRKEQEEELLSLSNEIAGVEMKVRSRTEKEERLRQEWQSLKIKIEQKHSRARLLDEMEKNMEGYTGSVKAVMRESRRGTLRGLHGALSQLISVQNDYACAIETALGAAIQNIVTENEGDAKRAMYFLRDSNAGRATFLPLSSIRARSLDERGLDDCYGYVNVASALVATEPKYADIIKSLLGKTVIVEDIDCAVAISKKYAHRFKIVTLDGQVINAGGSMTGGSRVQSSGFLSRSNEIEALQKDIAKSEAGLARLAAEHKAAAEDLAAQQAVLGGANAQKQTVAEDKMRTESALSLVSGQLLDCEEQAKRLKEEQMSASSRIQALAQTKQKAEQAAEALSAELAAAGERIEQLGEGKETLLRQKEELAQKTAEVSVAIAEITKEIEAQKESLESLVRRKESHSGRLGEINAAITEIQEKNKVLEEKMKQAQQACDVLRGQAAGVRAEIEALVRERESHEQRSSSLRAKEREKTEEHAKLGQELARLGERLESLKKEQEDVEKRLYEEYQLTRREAEGMELRIESPAGANKRLAELKSAIRSLGSVNVGAIEEYKEVAERFAFMSTQVGDTEKSKKELLKLIDELTEKMATRFREQFQKINENFKTSFVQLFSGGDAELVLEDESNILECGIEIKAQPPGKNVKSISLLSGGEKGLCAIALLFAMLNLTPAPFCVYDEVEAALDDVNVVRYASFVRKMAKNTQFILITHRRGTMEEADMLYGVTMQEEGVSKLLELKTAEMVKKLGLEA
ncbi:MAG: chromosome segregation protein SMC [Oscillospiraceae bacterium]|jgi:chromosome segregation protein|nr:chromosome segregation protein SMC [Oscillospiraceae bacterium]